MLNSQKWVKVKDPDGVQIVGVFIDLEWNDSKVNAVTITDTEGHVLKIAKHEYGDLHLLTPATMTKYKLHGNIIGIPFSAISDTREEAERKRDQLLTAIDPLCPSDIAIDEIEE
jgi:hypothetical protein